MSIKSIIATITKSLGVTRNVPYSYKEKEYLTPEDVVEAVLADNKAVIAPEPKPITRPDLVVIPASSGSSVITVIDSESCCTSGYCNTGSYTTQKTIPIKRVKISVVQFSAGTQAQLEVYLDDLIEGIEKVKQMMNK